jgi:hypothetical protein
MAHAIAQPTRYRGTVEEAEGLPRVQRHISEGARFKFAHYPTAWEYVSDETLKERGVTREELGLAKNGWLPVLSMIRAIPGVNGVGKDLRTDTPEAVCAGKGGTVIQPDDSRLGEFRDYMAWYDVRGGGKYFTSWCERVEAVLPSGQLIWDTVTASVEMIKFRAHLRDNLLAKPARGFPLAVIERESDQQKRYVELAGNNPTAARRADEQRKRIDAMRADLDAWLGKPNAKHLEFRPEASPKPLAEKAEKPPKQRRGDPEQAP